MKWVKLAKAQGEKVLPGPVLYEGQVITGLHQPEPAEKNSSDMQINITLNVNLPAKPMTAKGIALVSSAVHNIVLQAGQAQAQLMQAAAKKSSSK